MLTEYVQARKLLKVVLVITNGSRYLRMKQAKCLEDSL